MSETTSATIDLSGLPMMSPNGRPNHFVRARDIGPTQHRAVVRWGVPEAVSS